MLHLSVTLTHVRNHFFTAASTVGRIQHTHTTLPCLLQPSYVSKSSRHDVTTSLSWTHIDSQKKTTEIGISQNTRETVQDMWNSVLFTGESRFCLDRPDGRISVWTGECYALCCGIEGDRWG